MSTTAAAEKDPVRKKILAAMDRLLDGNPLRSTGRLSISQLAIEAGVARWRLTHQHLDLKEQFQARIKAADNDSGAGQLTDYEKLKDAHAELRKHCAELEERVQLYASVINLLALEKDAAGGETPVASLASARHRRTKPGIIGPC
jgi:hypothetical protein